MLCQVVSGSSRVCRRFSAHIVTERPDPDPVYAGTPETEKFYRASFRKVFPNRLWSNLVCLDGFVYSSEYRKNIYLDKSDAEIMVASMNRGRVVWEDSPDIFGVDYRALRRVLKPSEEAWTLLKEPKPLQRVLKSSERVLDEF
jgi:hypothetical protein